MTEESSHRQIVRSTSIIGGASVLNILVGLVRGKISALVLGPSGVGLVGLLFSLLSTSSAIAGLGFGNVGTRQIAEAVGREDEAAIAAARRAIVLGTLGLAVIGAAIFWLLRGPLAQYVLGDSRLTGDVGWLALALALTVAAASQSALLNGLRRIGDLARVSVISSVAATVVGVSVLLIFGARGLIAYVLITPIASFVVGHIYVARLPKLRATNTTLAELAGQWRALVRLGAAFMLAGLAGGASQLIVRSLIERRLGLDALGQFQAAFTISMTYISFVLGAMATDYYPRLTAAIRDPKVVNRMVNEQTEVALMLASPVLVAFMGFAPWVIRVLYSGRFAEAAAVLQWQILGDALKIVSWPLGFVILAAGAGGTFLVSEIVAGSVFPLATWILLPIVGVQASGLSFLAMYVVYLPIIYFLARRRTGFAWTKEVFGQICLTVGVTLTVKVAVAVNPLCGAVVSGLCTVGLSVRAFSGLKSVLFAKAPPPPQ
jgi:O-antigen/teichoic acid export membrane protein